MGQAKYCIPCKPAWLAMLFEEGKVLCADDGHESTGGLSILGSHSGHRRPGAQVLLVELMMANNSPGAASWLNSNFDSRCKLMGGMGI